MADFPEADLNEAARAADTTACIDTIKHQRDSAGKVVEITSTKSDYSANGYAAEEESAPFQNPGLADFDNNEGYVVGEGTVPPGSYAIEDCLLHIRECQRCRLEDQIFETFDAKHIVEAVKNLNESIGVQNEAITRRQVHFRGRLGRCSFGEATEDAVSRLQPAESAV